MAEVGCAGILVADMFCGPMQALPREGQLLAIDAIEPGAGGCAANVAISLAKQGFAVDLAGCVGTDSSAQSLVRSLEDNGVGCEHIAATELYPTSKTVILVVENQDRRYLRMFGANKAFTIGHIDRDWVAELKVLYLGGLLALPAIDMDECRELLAFCRRQQVVTVVDVVVPQDQKVAPAMEPLLPEIDYFLPNDDEAAQITGQTDPLRQLRELRARGARTAIVTLGQRGAVAVHNDQCWRIGAYRVDSVDPSGSGDAFSGGIIAGILRHLDMPQMLRHASAFGACATRALGTTGGLLSVAETEAFVEEHPVAVSSWSLQ
jgi:sugar/nucleoside kinase (ribokinase family)